MAFTIPTWLTLFRILTIPMMVIAFYWDHPGNHFIAAMIFTVGGLTDWLDGWIARRFNMGSAFGAFLDPVADKLLVVMALAFTVAMTLGVGAIAQDSLRSRSWGFVFPVIGVAAPGAMALAVML